MVEIHFAFDEGQSLNEHAEPIDDFLKILNDEADVILSVGKY